jgi:predicted nucleic acid-binding protein
LARFEREGKISQPTLQHGWSILGFLRESAVEIKPIEEVRSAAEHLLTRYPLRAADSLQLAAALFWRQGYTEGASFVTLDHRLHIAAALEGFHVLPYVDEVHESVEGYGDYLPAVLSARPISD